jgi:hypothetical protein
MSLQHIKVAIDPEKVLKGDVIIIKRTYFDPSAKLKLVTICTNCGNQFPTELRRMQATGKRGLEVRNVPQCAPCRSRYRNAPQRSEAAPLLLEGPAKPKALPASTTGLLRLEQWGIHGGRAFGILRGGDHPSGRYHDGDPISTSLIVEGPSIDEHEVVTIKTRSGSVYQLGQKYQMPAHVDDVDLHRAEGEGMVQR